MTIEADSVTALTDTQLTELCQALGWQGGTYHQALAAVQRHKAALDKIAERTGGHDPCGPLVQIARQALTPLDPRAAWPFPQPKAPAVNVSVTVDGAEIASWQRDAHGRLIDEPAEGHGILDGTNRTTSGAIGQP